MQSVHGTQDTVVYPQNLEEQIKQWTAVLDQSTTPLQTLVNTPNPNCKLSPSSHIKIMSNTSLPGTTYIFGDKYQAINATGVDHNIQTHTDTVLNFFDLKCSGTNCFGRPGPIVSVSSSRTTSSTRTSTRPVETTPSTTISRTTTTLSTTTRTSTPTPSTTVSRTSSVVTTSSKTTTAGGALQTQWGQCAGNAWLGPFVCAPPLVCKSFGEWYSQCL